MQTYIIRRLLLIVPTLLIVSLVIFFLIHLVPGDIIDAMLIPGDMPADRAMLERRLGLDAPLLVQYGRWVGFLPGVEGNFNGVFQGNLGHSFTQSESVGKLVALAWPVTIELTLLGMIIGLLIALPVGIHSALRQDRWGDYVGRSFAIACISVPAFWLGTLVIVFPAIWWGHMPPIMLTPFTEDPLGNLQMFIIPAIVLGMAMSGMTMRMTRTMMLEVLRQDYIRTAWAKGLRERVVVMRHALKNALIPVVTIVGIQMPYLLGGTVIIEQIFCLPGMGRLVINALLFRDKFLVCGIVLILGALLVLVNLMVDLVYAYLDPRVHYK